MSPTVEADERRITQALAAARDTRALTVEFGARSKTPAVFAREFGSATPIVIADANTFRAAGGDVVQAFGGAESFIFGPHLYADSKCVDELETVLRGTDAIPVAVGSGTINDVVKLASHRLGRRYMVVATAASMDGYTAYGASITHNGSKQTFACPAPRAVVADLEVIAKAPAGMNASGYADMLAKFAAGGDWMVADAAGEEPVDPSAWQAVQGPLRGWLSSPEKVAAGDPLCLRRLVYGLMMSGFVMQAARSSRPASGAEHQFSHLWDMQHHVYRGQAPSHGFKVGIGTLASLALYDELLRRDRLVPDADAAAARWPSWAQFETRIAELFGGGELGTKALDEMRAKYISREALRDQLVKLDAEWPRLRERLRRHLPRCAEARGWLRAAGAPDEPGQIGISRQRLRESYEQAWYIRRRYTILDFAQRAGLAESALDAIFGREGQA